MTKEEFWQKWEPRNRAPFKPSDAVKAEFMADLQSVVVPEAAQCLAEIIGQCETKFGLDIHIAVPRELYERAKAAIEKPQGER